MNAANSLPLFAAIEGDNKLQGKNNELPPFLKNVMNRAQARHRASAI